MARVGSDEAPKADTESEIDMKWLPFRILLLALAATGCSQDSEPETVGAEPTSTSEAETLEEADDDTAPESSVPSTEATEDPDDAYDDEADGGEPAAEPEGPVEVVLGDRVRGYFAAREAANAAPSPDPEYPGLSEYAVGDELATVVENTAARRDAGHAIRPGEGGLARVGVGFVEAGTSGASVAACTVDDGVIFDVETDAVVNDDVVTNNYRIDLELHDGLWKVATIVRVQQWEGVAGCALADGDYPY